MLIQCSHLVSNAKSLFNALLFKVIRPMSAPPIPVVGGGEGGHHGRMDTND